MTSSEDFKQAIRAGNISEAFLVAMSNAPELNITTKIITAEGRRIDSETAQIDNYLHTHINLIEGKVENEIGEKLTGDRYSEIKQFHLQQVTEGHETIQHNLISLQKMFQLMSSFQQQATNRANWVDIAADVSRESLSNRRKASQLHGNVHNALAGAKAENLEISGDEDNIEPQLPSFDAEEEEVVDDLMSLTDLDDDRESKPANADRADWSEWLDDEPDVKSEVFDLKSLKLEDTKDNWQNWQEQNEAVDTDVPEA